MLNGGGGVRAELQTEGPESFCKNVALIAVSASILFLLIIFNRLTHISSNV